jgi:hypothetical protein
LRQRFALDGDHGLLNRLSLSFHEIRLTTHGANARPRTLKPSDDRRGRGAAQAGAKDDSGVVRVPQYHGASGLPPVAYSGR